MAGTQLDLVVALASRVLGGHLAGLYLHGSAVAGGLRPDSDLDLLAVVDRSLTDRERLELIHGLLGLSGRGAAAGGARSLELSVVRRDAVRPWCCPPPVELQYGDRWRSELEAGQQPWRSPDPDLAIAVWAAREADCPLVGPPAAVLLDPVPADDLVRASLDGIEDLLAELETDTRNVLLTLARIWVTVSTGRVVGKSEAARWAAERLGDEDRAVILLADEAYEGGLREGWRDRRAAARRCAEALVVGIRGHRP